MYSKGMMQRIGLAQAMVNDPDLMLLDEPTDGVDPVGRRDIRDVLQRLRQRGKTIFINSHMLSELEMICNGVAILVAGQIARQGTLDELAMTRQYYAIEVGVAPDANLVDSVKRTLNGCSLAVSEQTLQVGTAEAERVQPAIDVLRAAGVVIRRVNLVRPSLEELFIEAVGAKREAGAQ
jgi:ABC-2 type transport system ATP-binding protein